MCSYIRFSGIAHLKKAPITTSPENETDSQSSAYRQKYIHLFKRNVLSAKIKKKTRYLI